MKRERNPARSILSLALLVVLPVFGTTALPHRSSTPASAATPIESPGAGDRDPLLYEAVLPDQRADIIAATAGRLSRYRLAVTLEPAPSAQTATPAASPSAGSARPPAMTIVGTEDLLYVNETGQTQTELWFRLYANDTRYAEGGISVQDAAVDGISVAVNTTDAIPKATDNAAGNDPTLLRIALPASVQPAGTAHVTMSFTTSVPTRPRAPWEIFAFDPERSTWALAGWFPILAGFDPVTGWELRPLSRWGDPIFANTALYDVTVTAPRDLRLVASGSELVAEPTGNLVRHRYVTGPVRDFALVADDNFATRSRRVGETTVTAHFNPEHAAGGETVLHYGAQALRLYSRLFGAYPYAELDLVEVPHLAGFEFPQLVYLGSRFFADPAQPGARPRITEFLVAHEVAHQWWYNLVGSNQYAHAFLDEGLTEYTATAYFEFLYHRLISEQQLALLRDRSTPGGASTPIDAPADAFTDANSYYRTIYRRGGFGFAELREEIGFRAFFGGLRDYAARFRFGVATPNDLRAAFERASGRDLTTFWRDTFETVGPIGPAATPPTGTPTSP